MKKVLILLAVLAVGVAATAQDVKIKRGKVTMSEADYNLLKQKADAYEQTKKTLDETLASYQKQQQMNDMYRPIELKTFTDSASYAIGRDIYQISYFARFLRYAQIYEKEIVLLILQVEPRIR